MIPFFEQFIFGLIQGVVEWLPFSSEGGLLLFYSTIHPQVDISFFVRQSLFLHLGTFFAALIYFRKDVKILWKTFRHPQYADRADKKVLNFIIIATIISGVLGLALLTYANLALDTQKIVLSSKFVTFLVGFFLVITGIFQIKSRRAGYRSVYHLNTNDAVLTGIAQGCAALPGLSRSGLTVSTMLFRNIDDATALKLSFLLSLPIVLIGNILLNFWDFQFVGSMLWGLLFSFIFGLLTIHLLMRVAHKVKFGHFVLIVGIITIISVFISLPFL